MFDDTRAFLTRAFLAREWATEYKLFQDSEAEAALLTRLREWARRPKTLKETQLETGFLQTFFVETWGYTLPRQGEGFSVQPRYPVAGTGQRGAAGIADAALGLFTGRPDAVPQVLCEFKDIRSGLDAPQARKGNDRSPVKQCLDYLGGARRPLIGHEPILPWFGLVTDMNEFRLYWWDRGDKQFLRFRIDEGGLLPDLLKDDEDARFDRFLFARIFHRDSLISAAGRPLLLRLVEKQGAREQALEGQFYADYKAVREHLFNALLGANPRYRDDQGRLLRLAQKILDRFIFAFYAEDMGARMLFPPQLIKERLTTASMDPFFEGGAEDLWGHFRRLFAAMNTGGRIGQIEMRQINGGLFQTDPEIDALTIPNDVFCVAGQGVNAATIQAHPDRLIHLCASYDYAARGAAANSITLYTLGRIFEQSITWLEIEEARLEGRKSLNKEADRKIPTRKSQGVYYTPEWVVDRVVGETLDPWFEARKAELGWTGDAPPDVATLDAYAARVRDMRVVDPACGSGAFLIGAFRRLLTERLAIDAYRRQLPGQTQDAASEAVLVSDILSRNIFGVDISAPAVEIAKLALWLHSARADAPLSSLDDAIVCGNSLVGSSFWEGKPPEARTAEAVERVNAFDWPEAFAFEGRDPGLFDVVVGNPPYVDIQTLRAVNGDVADHIRHTRGEDFYASAQTGNFDLYLPFIEKGLRLLRSGGRLGYIAPSIWPVAQYGRGLRTLVRQGRHLERWTDFRSHQIFREATTYTALQIFSADPAPGVRVAMAPGGEAEVADIDWSEPERLLGWDRLADGEPWLLATGEDRALIDRLAETGLRLDDPAITTGIIVGIQTSLDYVYHLERLGAGRYRCNPKDGQPTKGRPHSPPYEVQIEDSIMRPLVSGEEAKRYQEPETQTYLLFPYEADAEGRMRLIPAERMADDYPLAWAHLRRWETELRAREHPKMDDDEKWWGYVYPKNLGLQEVGKLIVAQTVPEMRVCADLDGRSYLNNVRVNGILAPSETTLAYLLGVLNGVVVDFVFRRIGKPKDGGWFEANRQFIAPLPIPVATAEEQAEIGDRALALQALHTRKRQLREAVSARLARLGSARGRDARWLWPDLPDREALEETADRRRLKTRAERRQWAQAQYDQAAEARCAALQAELDRAGPVSADLHDGEVRLIAGGAKLLGVFLDPPEDDLTRAWWDWLALIGSTGDAARLSDALRTGPVGGDAPPARQFIERVDELKRVVAEIATAETVMNGRLYDLYGLTPRERRLVEAG